MNIYQSYLILHINFEKSENSKGGPMCILSWLDTKIEIHI